MRLPENKLLRLLIGIFAGGVVFKLIIEFSRRDQGVGDAVGNVIVNLLAPYFIGSFSSSIPLVWIGSTACGVAYAISVSKSGVVAARVAKFCLFTLLTLSLFTIWINPYPTLSGAAVSTAMQFAKVPLKVLDMGVSVVWVMGYIWSSAALDRESREAFAVETSAGWSPPRGLILVSGVMSGILVLLSIMWQWINM
jgi:hypothetical protein